MNRKQHNIIKWAGRIVAVAILVFALPFYVGYGNPLPFAKPSYSTWENIALTMVPLVLFGLLIGLKYPKVGGWLVITATATGFAFGLITGANLSINLVIPIIPAVLYLLSGYYSKAK